MFVQIVGFCEVRVVDGGIEICFFKLAALVKFVSIHPTFHIERSVGYLLDVLPHDKLAFVRFNQMTILLNDFQRFVVKLFQVPTIKSAPIFQVRLN